MKSVIEKIYTGRLEPGADYTVKSEEYKDIRRELLREHKFFEEKLREIDPRLECRFKQLLDDMNIPGGYEQRAMFTGAFKLGARFMLEILQDEEG